MDNIIGRGGVKMENNNRNTSNKNDNRKKNKNNIIMVVIAALITLLMFSYIQSMIRESSYKEVTYKEFIEALENKTVDKVVVASDRVEYELKEKVEGAPVTYYAARIYDEKLLDRIQASGATSYNGKLSDTGSGILEFLLTSFHLQESGLLCGSLSV